MALAVAIVCAIVLVVLVVVVTEAAVVVASVGVVLAGAVDEYVEVVGMPVVAAVQ